MWLDFGCTAIECKHLYYNYILYRGISCITQVDGFRGGHDKFCAELIRKSGEDMHINYTLPIEYTLNFVIDSTTMLLLLFCFILLYNTINYKW